MASQAPSTDNTRALYLGAGCFWCVEAVFNEVQGVRYVEPGYAGGDQPNVTYREVCTGNTGHAEVVRIDYRPEEISMEQLLTVFWHVHDPTTLNRQGADVGPQYRSVIFYQNEEEKAMAEKSRREADASDLWRDPIVTTLEPLKNYTPAEEYHHQFYLKNEQQPYCSLVIAPKLAKFRKTFAHWLKPTQAQA